MTPTRRPRKRSGVRAALLLLAALPLAGAADPGPGPLLGFSAARSAEQRQREARFDAALDAAQIGEWIRTLSARPHHLGSPYGRENAELMARLFREWGYEAAIEQYSVLFPVPTLRRVELLAPQPFVAGLEEEQLAEDATSGQRDEQLPVYNAYSIDGDVTGELVYVNYGVPADYEELDRRGIDVEGKIVIARYGGSWRGIKPKVAAEHGAVGCLIYSDPRDDGYFAGDTYPLGGWRPAQGAQRGSVADMPLYPGDPATPGVGAVEGAERLPRERIATLTKIPVLPISARDAQPLLAALAGPMAPRDWRGALPLPYHLGPGPAKVRLQVAFDWTQAPLYNVIAKLPGRELPDQWIVRGNHHDAWVNGATDPVSGMAAVLAEARAVGQLARSGWRPRRTIVYAGWDGEEPGLLGSTEWVEHHRDELRRKVVAYLNTDSNGRGVLSAGGSPTLQPLVTEVASEVRDPLTGASVLERARAWLVVHGDDGDRERVKATAGMPVYPLGSGSDYTPFLQHLGVASLNLDFFGEDQYGQYHSVYDSYDHYARFMDPGFDYGVALAKVLGRLTLRLADADTLPFDPEPLAADLARWRTEVKELADERREETEEENRRIREGVYAAAADPKERWVVPEAREPVPFLNFAPLDNAVSAVQDAAARHAKAREDRLGRGPLAPAVAARYDEALRNLETALTRPQGLPGRPWFVHQAYAPGFYTGYGVKTLPAVREAIEQRQYGEVEGQVEAVAATLRGLAAAIDAATAVLEQG